MIHKKHHLGTVKLAQNKIILEKDSSVVVASDKTQDFSMI